MFQKHARTLDLKILIGYIRISAIFLKDYSSWKFLQVFAQYLTLETREYQFLLEKIKRIIIESKDGY